MAKVIEMIREAAEGLAMLNKHFPNPEGTALRRKRLLEAELKGLRALVASRVGHPHAL